MATMYNFYITLMLLRNAALLYCGDYGTLFTAIARLSAFTVQ